MAVSSSNPMLQIPTYTTSGAVNAAAAASGKANNTVDQTQNFLKLLVAQIQNQDPMSPMDASTMTNQMSQLNMVSSMGTMNNSLNSMLSQMQSSNFASQTNMIGHTPLVAGNTINYPGSGAVTVGADLATAANSLVANVIDNATGNTVVSVNLGGANAGMKIFQWAGTDLAGNQLPAGNYSLKLSAVDATGVTSNPNTLIGSPVAAVAKGSGTTVNFTLQDGRTVDSAKINQWVS